MPEEKDYILYFYDGAVKRMRGLLSDFQKLPIKKIEEVVPGFDPLTNTRKDMERIRKALGGVIKLIRPGSNGGFFRGG